MTVKSKLQNLLSAANTVTGEADETLTDAVQTLVDGYGQGGESVVVEKDVNFIDYDGTILHSYTSDEFSSLTALPDNPIHEGLTSQGWNWTLSDAQAYTAAYGKLWIGQMYITDDSKTRVYIHLEEGRTSPILGCCPKGTVDVDWGDGTTHDTLTGTSTTWIKWTPTHHYAAAGDYVIKLTVTGSMGLYGNTGTNTGSALLRDKSGTSALNNLYMSAIRKVELGTGITEIDDYVFNNCYSLESITIPDAVTGIGANSYVVSCKSLTIPIAATYMNAFGNWYSLTRIALPKSLTALSGFSSCSSLTSITISDSATNIGTYTDCKALSGFTIPAAVTGTYSNMFQNCTALKNVSIPSTLTNLGSYAFDSCFALTSITIPPGVRTINAYILYRCYSLASLTIPASVTSIGTYAFASCSGLASLRFLPTTPPTVSNKSTFNNLPTDCIIHVPNGSLSAYTSAANYPVSTTYTYVEDPA